MPQQPLAEGHGPAKIHLMPRDGATDAVVVLPGGGYGMCSDREAENVGDWLHSLGLAAAVLRYSVKPDRPSDPLDDALEAIRQTRRMDGIGRVGVIGFSAGGHLAAWAACVGQGESRPDVAVLCYPVVSLKERYTHGGSRDNLLGVDASPDDVAKHSIETLLHADVPPTFVWATSRDEPVPPQNSLMLATRLAELDVPFELHVFERGRHGVGLLDQPDAPPELAAWMTHAADFLRRRGFGG